MRRIVDRAFTIRFVLCSVILSLCAAAGGGQVETASSAGKPWTRIEEVGRYALRGDVLDPKNISGVAFISERFGLIGADEVRAVQAIEISRQTRTLRILDTITLAPSGSEIDIEAIAAEGDSYYITGSHGASKKKGEEQDNRYSIFRLPVDPATGLPRGFQSGSSSVPAGVQRASLSGVLRADPVLGPHFEQPLQHKGINIEGLAIRNGQLFVGFRNPNLGGYAFVMEIRADDVFSGRPRSPYTLHKLRLGVGLGIREIVAAQSGFLLIAGNAGSEPSKKYPVAEDYEEHRGFFLYSWDGKGTDAHQIGQLPKTDGGKAEAMVILEETKDSVTVLVMFDSANRGRPTVYRIS